MLQKLKDHFVSYNEDGDMCITLFPSIADIIIIVLAIVAIVEFIIIRKKKKNK